METMVLGFSAKENRAYSLKLECKLPNGFIDQEIVYPLDGS